MNSEAAVLRALMHFYSVTSLEEVVIKQNEHIERLQQKLMAKANWMYVNNNRQG
jgi:uncharacterized small protein (DUF1192 family)